MGVHHQALREVSLADRYDLGQDRILISGTQAIVRLALMQRERDRRAGLDTAGYVSGYRGSPLGGLDQQFMRAAKVLGPAGILFQPGLNEDLAATALWGSQQAEMRGEGRHDGVFGIWYGKGPGVDRSGDALRHANLAGSSRHGGVLALMGDDHTCESSTTAHQSEFHFVDAMIPILNPAGVQEILDYGLYGFAMSRFTGAWVGLKCMKDTIESTAVVDAAIDRVRIVIPDDFVMPPGGLNIRPKDHPLQQEERLQEFKRDAMLAFLRANRLNRIVTSGGRNPRIGIITVGKSYLDVRQALDDLGIDEVAANDLGIRLYKIGCPWPLEPTGLYEFARGLDLIMVVEEKRSLIEVQVREELYGSPSQPACIGKKDEAGRWLFPVKGALDPNDIAVALGDRLLRYHRHEALAARVAALREAQRVLRETADVATRTPYFCAGCPHNSSTVVPEGARAYAGIGCHYMVQLMDRRTEGYTHMGGEGANWIGEAPFSSRAHVFQNLGDGTFNHSGSLAIRAALAAGVNITYKILFNDAVAMTGGQKNEGGLTVDRVARIVAAEGVSRITLVAEEPERHQPGSLWPPGISFHGREALDEVQRDLAREPGVSVLIYDQTCAAEKRRRRKRGEYPDPDLRVVINELVCEGCGDCGEQSNCVAIQPVDTEFGRKRKIDQSSCNKDFSCLKGFCPSFVTVTGARPRTAAASGAAPPGPADLPDPQIPGLDRPWSLIVTGVAGTGVVTVGAILGMAAHLEEKACGMIDMAGLAQKGGAVYSHVRIAAAPEDIHAIRVAAGMADLVLGCDIVVAGTKRVLASVRPGGTAIVVNTHETYPGDFTRDADFSLPAERLKRTIERASPGRTSFIDATRLAGALCGNSIAGNILLVGYAFQKGAIPLSAAAIERAIGLNGEAVEMNIAAFRWGRRAAIDPDAVAALASPAGAGPAGPAGLEAFVARRAEFLTGYQNAAWAARYRDTVGRVAAAEAAVGAGDGLAFAVARSLFRLMAVKDEYEVARLYTDGSFERQLRSEFAAWERLEFHLAPPVLGRRDPVTGRPRKSRFGPWMLPLFRLLAGARFLRGTFFDPFGRTAERRADRRLLARYRETVDLILARLSPDNHAAAMALAAWPDRVRGYGHVREASIARALDGEERLAAAFRSGEMRTISEAAE